MRQPPKDMNTDDADDEMSETTGMYISEDVGLVKVVEDHTHGMVYSAGTRLDV